MSRTHACAALNDSRLSEHFRHWDRRSDVLNFLGLFSPCAGTWLFYNPIKHVASRSWKACRLIAPLSLPHTALQALLSSLSEMSRLSRVSMIFAYVSLLLSFIHRTFLSLCVKRGHCPFLRRLCQWCHWEWYVTTFCNSYVTYLAFKSIPVSWSSANLATKLIPYPQS